MTTMMRDALFLVGAVGLATAVVVPLWRRWVWKRRREHMRQLLIEEASHEYL